MDKPSPLRLVVMGRPGAGKGTQAQLLARRLGLVNIDLGQLLRQVAIGNSRQAHLLNALLSRGSYAPAELSLSLLCLHLESPESQLHGFVLDGYPRFVAQVDLLVDLVSPAAIDAAVLLEVPEREAFRRLEKRRECVNCKRQPIRESAYLGQCEFCGGHLTRRADDWRDALLRRISTFEAKMSPIIQRYDGDGLLQRIDGSGPVQLVHERLLTALGLRGYISGSPLL